MWRTQATFVGVEQAEQAADPVADDVCDVEQVDVEAEEFRNPWSAYGKICKF